MFKTNKFLISSILFFAYTSINIGKSPWILTEADKLKNFFSFHHNKKFEKFKANSFLPFPATNPRASFTLPPTPEPVSQAKNWSDVLL